MMIFLGGMYKVGGERGLLMNGGGYGGAFPVVGVVLHVLTWVAVLAVLFALARLLWKKGDKVK